MLGDFGKKIIMSFFEGILEIKNSENIDFDKWKGEIVKDNINVNPDIIKYFELDFGLPVFFNQGIVSSVRINIPWKSFLDENITLEMTDFFLVLDVKPEQFEEYLRHKEIIEKSSLKKEFRNWLMRRVQNKTSSLNSFIFNYVRKKVRFCLTNLVVLFHLRLSKTSYFFLVQIDRIEYNFKNKFKDVDAFDFQNFSIKVFTSEHMYGYLLEKTPSALSKHFPLLVEHYSNLLLINNFAIKIFDLTQDEQIIRQATFSVDKISFNIDQEKLEYIKYFIDLVALISAIKSSSRMTTSLRIPSDPALEKHIRQFWLNKALAKFWKTKRQKKLGSKEYFVRVSYLARLLEIESLTLIEEMLNSSPDVFVKGNNFCIDQEELSISSVSERIKETMAIIPIAEFSDAIEQAKRYLASETDIQSKFDEQKSFLRSKTSNFASSLLKIPLQGKKGFSRFTDKLQSFLIGVQVAKKEPEINAQAIEIDAISMNVYYMKKHLISASLNGLKSNKTEGYQMITIDSVKIMDEDVSILTTNSPFLTVQKDQESVKINVNSIFFQMNSYIFSNCKSFFSESLSPIFSSMTIIKSMKKKPKKKFFRASKNNPFAFAQETLEVFKQAAIKAKADVKDSKLSESNRKVSMGSSIIDKLGEESYQNDSKVFSADFDTPAALSRKTSTKIEIGSVSPKKSNKKTPFKINFVCEEVELKVSHSLIFSEYFKIRIDKIKLRDNEGIVDHCRFEYFAEGKSKQLSNSFDLNIQMGEDNSVTLNADELEVFIEAQHLRAATMFSNSIEKAKAQESIFLNLPGAMRKMEDDDEFISARENISEVVSSSAFQPISKRSNDMMNDSFEGEDMFTPQTFFVMKIKEIETTPKTMGLSLKRMGFRYIDAAKSISMIFSGKDINLESVKLDRLISIDNFTLIMPTNMIKDLKIPTPSESDQKLSISILNQSQIVFVDPLDVFKQPCAFIFIKKFLFEKSNMKKSVQASLQVDVKSVNSAFSEPFLESLVMKVESTPSKISVDIPQFQVNFKPSLMEVILRMIKSIKTRHSQDPRIQKIIISNMLGVPLKIGFNFFQFSCESSFQEFSLANDDSTTEMNNFLDVIFRKSYKKSSDQTCLDILLELEKTNEKERFSRRWTTGDKTFYNNLSIKVGNLPEIIFEEVENSTKSLIVRSDEFAIIAEIVKNNRELFVYVRTNILLKNKTDSVIIVEAIKKSRADEFEKGLNFMKAELKVKAFSEREIIEGPLKLEKKSQERLKCFDEKNDILIRLNSNQRSNMVQWALHRLLTDKNPNIILNSSTKSFIVEVKKKYKGKSDYPEYEICFDAPIKLRNNLPIDLKMSFAQSRSNIESLKRQLNPLGIKLEANEKIIELKKFTYNKSETFLIDEFPILQLSDLKHEFLILKDEKEPGESEFFEDTDPESSKLYITRVRGGPEYGRQPINCLAKVKLKASQMKIDFSSELIFLNESPSKFRIHLVEDDFEYDPFHISSDKYEQCIEGVTFDNRSIQEANVICLKNMIRSENYPNFVKSNGKYLTTFTGNCELIGKKIVIESTQSNDRSIFSFADFTNPDKKTVFKVGDCSVGIQFLQVKSPFSLFGLVIFHPIIFLISECGEDMILRSEDFTNKILIIKKNRLYPIDSLFLDEFVDKQNLLIKPNNNDYNWSASFSVAEQKPVDLRIRSLNSKQPNFSITVETVSSSLSQLVTIKLNLIPNVTVLNSTNFMLYASQQVNDLNKESIPSNSTKQLFLDHSRQGYLMFFKRLSERDKMEKIFDFEVVSMEQNSSVTQIIEFSPNVFFKVTLSNDSKPIIAITACEDEDEMQNHKRYFKFQKFIKNSLDVLKLSKFIENKENKQQFSIVIKVGIINVSVITDQPQELAMITFRKLGVDFESERLKTGDKWKLVSIDANLEDLQIDCQLPGLLHNNFLTKSGTNNRLENQIVLHVRLQHNPGKLIVEVLIRLPTMNIYICDNFILALINFCKRLSNLSQNLHPTEHSEENVTSTYFTANSIADADISPTKQIEEPKEIILKKVNIESFRLNVIMVETAKLSTLVDDNYWVRYFLIFLQNMKYLLMNFSKYGSSV